MSNKTNKTDKAILMVLTLQVLETSTGAKKTVNFNDDEKLTAQFARFLETQDKAFTATFNGQSFNVSGKTSGNRAERNFAMLTGILSIVFKDVADKTVVIDSWIVKNLAKSFKVAALSHHSFMTVIGAVKGIYRDAVKVQKLKTELLNKSLIQTRQKSQAELKLLVEQYRKELPAPKPILTIA